MCLFEVGKITGQWGLDVLDNVELSWVSSETAEVNCNISSVFIVGKSGEISILDCDLVVEFSTTFLNF